MVLIASDVAGRSAFDFARGVRKTVPNGFAFSSQVPGAFDLVCGRGHAPEKSVGKSRTGDSRRGNAAGNLLRNRIRSSGGAAVGEQSGACHGGKRTAEKLPTVHFEDAPA